MRLGSRHLRNLALILYLCLICAIVLRQSYFLNNVGENDAETDDESSDNDRIDEKLIVGRRPNPPLTSEEKHDNGIILSTKADEGHSKDSYRTILMWMGSEIGQQHLGGCPQYRCRITTDKSELNRSHALVFHNALGETPPVRFPWQYYVFFTQESPMHMYVQQPYDGFFNMTLGYRRDADAPCPYGYAVRRRRALSNWPSENLTALIAGKDKTVAWFVSNCGAPSRRDAYVREMQKYIDVDIYGGCGTFSCPKGAFQDGVDDCNTLLERRYKFYLAFENSVCKDYATEKFWEKMTLNVVVIVLKRSVVEEYAPPNSFIAADDFNSPRSLALYLKKLHSDVNAYKRLFEWRRKYKAIFLNGRTHDATEGPWGFCSLCRRLWEKPPFVKTYPQLNRWWVDEAHCDNDLVSRLVNSTK